MNESALSQKCSFAQKQARCRACACRKATTFEHRELSERVQAYEQQFKSNSQLQVNSVLSETCSEPPIIHKLQNAHDSANLSIRLFKLHAGSPKDCLTGEIVNSNLVDHPEYLALSYTWGTGQGDERCSVQNGTVSLNKTVAEALKTLRSIKNHTYVWVDALCIDQGSRLDFAAHISQMDSIYRHAQFVVWWLWQSAPGLFLNSKPSSDCPWLRAVGVARLSVFDKLYSEGTNLAVSESRLVSHVAHPIGPTKRANTFTMQEFEGCRSTLGEVFRTCDADEYGLLGIVLSALAISFRSLTLRETTRIVALTLQRDSLNQPLDDATEYFILQGQYYQHLMEDLENRVQQNWSSILRIDDFGTLSFTHSHTTLLLRSIELPGIHPTHSFMTDLCLKELTLSAAAAESTCNLACEQSHILSDFHAYSFEFWSSHYQPEQHDNPVLTGRVHSFLWQDLSNLKLGDADRHESAEEACSIYCLECLEWAISYCSRHHLDCLKEIYDQLRRVSRHKVHALGPTADNHLNNVSGLFDSFNGLEISTLRDSECLPTIGYSHQTSTRSEHNTKQYQPIADSQTSSISGDWVVIKTG